MGFIDMIADRVTALGGESCGTVRMAAAGSRLQEYSNGPARGLQHVQALAERHCQYATTIRADINRSAEAGDTGTADLLTEVVRTIDKPLWFLDAQLQPKG